MFLGYNGCRITIEDNLIRCSYGSPYTTMRWQIILTDTDICFTPEGKEKRCFKIDEIKEFQFEMGDGASRGSYKDIPAAIAYVVLKADDDPKDLFYFSVPEEYTLLNQTKAHEFCSQILNYIGERYGIPAVYKISIETKKKVNTWAMAPLLIFFIMFLIWLRLKYGS